MKRILVYEGPGVGPESLRQILRELRSECAPPFYSVETVSPSFFISENWEEGAFLLVFPGGRDLPYHHLLQGAASGRISRFVSQGGRYLGMCAGAYFACAAIEFARGSSCEVIGGRELAFFPGVAIGPAYTSPPFHYHSGAGARKAPIRWSQEKTTTFLYYYGGCYFDSPENTPHVSVLAHYADLKQAAIISCSVGLGKALLSGIHPEFSISNPLQERKRRHFWKRFLSHALS